MTRYLLPTLLVSAFFALLLLGVVLGLPEALAPDGLVNRRLLLASLLLYWALSVTVTSLLLAWEKHRKQLLLAAGSVTLVLVVAELALRSLKIPAALPPVSAVFSPEYHHAYPPNRRMFAVVHGVPVIVSTNADGLRTSYELPAFLQHSPRIVVLGDSYAFGFLVSEREAFPTQLENLLGSQISGNVAVLNAGVISYSPFLEKLQFDGLIRKYDPTLVLLLLDAGDFGDDYVYMKAATKAEGSVRFPQDGRAAPAYFGALFQLVRDPLTYPLRKIKKLLLDDTSQSFRYERFEVSIGGVVETNRYFIYRHPPSLTRPYFEATLKNIQSIAQSAHNMGADFCLVVSPRFHHWNPRECRENWEASSYALDEPYQYEYLKFFVEVAPTLDFPVLNLLPAFENAERSPLVFSFDPHWNPEGHLVAASAVAEFLVERGLAVESSRKATRQEGGPAGADGETN